MYKNIGKKIKILAKVIFWIEIVASIITSLSLIFSGISYYYYSDLIPIGILIFFIAPVLFWISNFFIYGFGELIDKTCEIEKNTRTCNPVTSAPSNASSPIASPNANKISQLQDLRSKNLITEEEYSEKLKALQEG